MAKAFAGLLYALLIGAVGAGIVHIAILFMLPAYSDRDIWSRLSAVAGSYSAVRLDDSLPGGAPAPLNPLMTAVGCRFDLADGPLHVQAPGNVPFWSMAIYDSNGLNVFSISDRASNDRSLDFVTLGAAQMNRVRSELPDAFERSIFVETDVDQGIVLVRVFVPDETWRGVVDRFLGGLSCRPFQLD